MKKLITIAILATLLLTAKSVFAQSVLPATSIGSPASRIKTSVESNLIDNLKQRAQTEITRRLTFLNDLLTKLTDIKKLSDADKASLQNQIQTQIDGLNTLQTKINSDTDLTTLRTDVKSIVNGYYIFAFFRVKISLLVAADRFATTADSLSSLEVKLDTRVQQASASGQDVSSLNVLLADMTTKIADAKAKYQAVETDLASLTAQDFPGNKSVLLSERAKLKTAYADLRAAYQDAIKIRKGLGDLGDKINNSSSSASENLSPTPTTSL